MMFQRERTVGRLDVRRGGGFIHAQDRVERRGVDVIAKAVRGPRCGHRDPGSNRDRGSNFRGKAEMAAIDNYVVTAHD